MPRGWGGPEGEHAFSNAEPGSSNHALAIAGQSIGAHARNAGTMR